MIEFILTAGIEYGINNVPVEDSEKALDAIGKLIADASGGYTRRDGRGGWKDDSGELIEEAVAQFVFYLPESRISMDRAKSICLKARDLLNQQCVALRAARVESFQII